MNEPLPSQDDKQLGDLTQPGWLNLPPSDIEPPVVTRAQILPLPGLSWENFERLCLRLLRREHEITGILCHGSGATRLYGERGQAQHGIDIYSRDPLVPGQKAPLRSNVCLQSRRISKVTAGGLKKAVSDFLDGRWAATSRSFIYATSASGVATDFTDEVEAQARRLAAEEISFVLWDAEELSVLLRESPALVDDFFGRPWVDAFCGTDAAARLGSRLDGQHVAELRAAMGEIYRATFGVAEAGQAFVDIGAITFAPTEDRFITPDLMPVLAREDVGTSERASESGPPDPEHAELHAFVSSSLTDGDRKGRGSLEDDWLMKDRPFLSELSRSSRMGALPAPEWFGTSLSQVVVGEPGAGKSTLLRHLVLDLLGDNPSWSAVAERWGGRLPVWLPFHFFTQCVEGSTGRSASIAEAIKSWFEQHDFGHVWPIVERAIEDERLLLVVDGLDEWSSIEAGRYAAAALETFATARSIAVVVSTRPYGLNRLALTDRWDLSQIAPLSTSQQTDLARSYFSVRVDQDSPASRAVAESALVSFMNELEKSVDLRNMASVPLFLVLLVAIQSKSGGRLPDRRFEVFDQAIQLLIEDHPSRRRIAAAVTTARSGLGARQLRSALAQVAHAAHCRSDLRSINEETFRSDLVAALEDPETVAFTRADAIRHADEISAIAEGELGLLVRHGPKEVGFVHRSLQEQLTAEHIAFRLPFKAQTDFLLASLGDNRGREVLLGVFRLTVRSEERKQLANAIKGQIGDTPAGLAAAEVLAEIVFGPYDLPGQQARELGEWLARRFESHPFLKHRQRLLAHILSGTSNLAVREISAERIRRWAVLKPPPETVESANLGAITSSGSRRSLELAFAALGHLNPRVVWAAVPSLVERLSTRSSDSKEYRSTLSGLASVLASPTSATSAAAALSALCLAAPNEERTLKAIEEYRHSHSSGVRTVALGHLLGVLGEGVGDSTLSNGPNKAALSSAELDWVETRIFDFDLERGVHGGISRAVMAAAALGNDAVLDHCLRVMERGVGSELDIAWALALRSHSQNGRVVDLVCELIRTEERPWPLLSGSVTSDMAKAFGTGSQHKTVVANAIEHHLETFDRRFMGMTLHPLSAIDQGPIMRSQLLEDLEESSTPHWAAASLTENFAQDSEVEDCLRTAIAADPLRSSRISGFATKILGTDAGRERLLAILRQLHDEPPDEGSPRFDMIAGALVNSIEQADDEERSQVCRNALSLLPEDGPFQTTPRFNLAVHLSPLPEALTVLDLVRDRPDYESFLPGLIYADRDNPTKLRPLITRAIEMIRIPPPSLRREINGWLAAQAEPGDLVLEACEGWADDPADEVKTSASLAYHRALLAERERGNIDDEAWDAALQHLGTIASSYGSDYEAKRRAAWVGMCALGRWEPVQTLTERMKPNDPVSVGLGDVFQGPDEILVDQIGNNWSALRSVFGDALIERLSGRGHGESTSATWSALATVARRFPSLQAELRVRVEIDEELLAQEGVLAWYVSDPNHSRLSVTEVVASGVVSENNSRGLATRIAQDAQAAALDIEQLEALLDERSASAANRTWVRGFGDAVLEVLAVIAPEHPRVQEAWSQIDSAFGLSEGTKSSAGAPEAPHNRGELEMHPQTYLAVAYSAVPSRLLGSLLRHDLDLVARGSLQYYESAIVRHFRRRVRADIPAAESVRQIASDPLVPIEVRIQSLSLLAAAIPDGRHDLEEFDDCLAELQGRQVAPLLRDVVLGASVSGMTSVLHAATATHR